MENYITTCGSSYSYCISTNCHYTRYILIFLQELCTSKSIVSLLLAGVTVTSAASSAASICSPSSSDTDVLQFALGLSNFIGEFYNSTVNSTFGSSNNATIQAYQRMLFDFEKDNTLSSAAIEKVGAKAPGFSKPNCDYKFPEVNSSQHWTQWAYRFEDTVTGAFIGLAGYTESPEVSSWLVWLPSTTPTLP
ncbi:unnamed protein product [Penicillium nalgiovense]|nr:unnamed protein product [Penicillium nalgiovense]